MRTRGSGDATEIDGAHQSSPPPNPLSSHKRKVAGSSKKKLASDDTSHEQVRRFKAWTESPGSPPRKRATPAGNAGPLSPQRPSGVFPLPRITARPMDRKHNTLTLQTVICILVGSLHPLHTVGPILIALWPPAGPGASPGFGTPPRSSAPYTLSPTVPKWQEIAQTYDTFLVMYPFVQIPQV